MMRPRFEYDYTAKGSFVVYFEITPRDDHCKFSLEIHLFGRNIWFAIRQSSEEFREVGK